MTVLMPGLQKRLGAAFRDGAIWLEDAAVIVALIENYGPTAVNDDSFKTQYGTYTVKHLKELLEEKYEEAQD